MNQIIIERNKNSYDNLTSEKVPITKTIMNKSKFAMAIALSSCTLMGYFSHNEMLGTRPAAELSGLTINYT